MAQDIFPWKRVETFIGRTDYLDWLSQLLQDGKFHLVAISGEYGYGKTRLLKELLSKAHLINNLTVPNQLIDLYQTENHSPQGLAQAIVNSFGEAYSNYFHEYERHKNERDQAVVAGSQASIVRKEEDAMLDACAAGLKKLSQEQPFLLLFDTAERWVYPTLPEFPFSEKAAPALEWLLNVCQILSQGMFLLAGRPEIEELELPNAERKVLPAFSGDDIQQYLQETCELFASKFGRNNIAFTTKEVRVLTILSQGRPILLTLFLERILYGDLFIRAATETSTPDLFESVLITNLVSDKNIGEILRHAGRAPKGVTLDMLCLMMGLTKDALAKDFEILKAMSFAKTFEGNERLFLHDEMYDMLARHIYSQPGDDIEADNAALGLYEFYKSSTSDLNKQIGQLYAEYASNRGNHEAAELLWKLIDEKLQTLQTLNAEFVFYRWQRAGKKKNPDVLAKEVPIEMGLRRYYRIGHEAATSSEYQMLVWLRFELIRFIQHLQKKEAQGQPQSWLPFLQGFLYLQEVWENNASGKSVNIAAEIENRMIPALEKIGGLQLKEKQVLIGMLQTWQGMVYIYSSSPSYSQAEKAFNDVIDSLKEHLNWQNSLTWFAKATLVLAYRQRAYLKKRQYALTAAIRDYKKAAKINRSLDFNFEEAMIRNDLGDTQVLIGDFDEARLNLQDAFELRQQMKNGARLALSYSTFARYFTATGAVSQARISALRGINLSSRVGRGTALARISFAEATRRYAQELGTPEKRREELFEQAREALEIALDGLREPILQLDGFIEQACLYRDWMRYAINGEKEKYFNLANEKFIQVYQMAKAQKPQNTYRMADAMSNRIWLGLFKKDAEFVEKAVQEFKNLDIFPVSITETGSIKAYQGYIQQNGKYPLVQFIGKYYIGRGTFELGKDGGQLWRGEAFEVALYWMLGLEYTHLFAESYRGLAAAREHIYKKIRKFGEKEVAWLLEELEKAEQLEGITRSNLRILIHDTFGAEDNDE